MPAPGVAIRPLAGMMRKVKRRLIKTFAQHFDVPAPREHGQMSIVVTRDKSEPGRKVLTPDAHLFLELKSQAGFAVHQVTEQEHPLRGTSSDQPCKSRKVVFESGAADRNTPLLENFGFSPMQIGEHQCLASWPKDGLLGEEREGLPRDLDFAVDRLCTVFCHDFFILSTLA